MKPIIATTNETKNAFSFDSDYNRNTLLDWFKKYTHFKIEPIVKESIKGRSYLEGAIVMAYCKWQYGIDPREKGKGESRRFLFKQDFHYDIIKDRNGNPKKIIKSSLGEANSITNKYIEWATENGAPIPNRDLYKLYDTQYRGLKFPTFWDWLEYLNIDCDAMPSKEMLQEFDFKIDYPEEDNKTAFDD